MQTSFILSTLAFLCSSHPAFATEATVETIEKLESESKPVVSVRKCSCPHNHGPPTRQFLARPIVEPVVPKATEEAPTRQFLARAPIAQAVVPKAEEAPTRQLLARPIAEPVVPKAEELAPKNVEQPTEALPLVEPVIPKIEELALKNVEQPTEALPHENTQLLPPTPQTAERPLVESTTKESAATTEGR